MEPNTVNSWSPPFITGVVSRSRADPSERWAASSRTIRGRPRSHMSPHAMIRRTVPGRRKHPDAVADPSRRRQKRPRNKDNGEKGTAGVPLFPQGRTAPILGTRGPHPETSPEDVRIVWGKSFIFIFIFIIACVSLILHRCMRWEKCYVL